MLGSLLRTLFSRRLARVLPGGWLTVLLLSGPSRAAARWGWRKVQARRAPIEPPPPPVPGN